MSELNLSLYHLAEGGDLLELFEMRAEALRESDSLLALGGPDTEQYESALADLRVLDDQLASTWPHCRPRSIRCATSGSASRC